MKDKEKVVFVGLDVSKDTLAVSVAGRISDQFYAVLDIRPVPVRSHFWVWCLISVIVTGMYPTLLSGPEPDKKPGYRLTWKNNDSGFHS